MNKISPKTSERVCKHMNNDHIDSVYLYLKNYANITDFKQAYLEEINSKFMKIKYDDKTAIINFEKHISEEEIHSTLVSMTKKI